MSPWSAPEQLVDQRAPRGSWTPPAGPWIETASGRCFDLVDPRPEDVDIRDIAHALAHVCRFNGHCRDFYSVAEHCVSMYRSPTLAGASWAEQMWALLHDATEAYLPEVTRPLKSLLGDKWAAIELRVELAIATAFDLPLPLPQSVKELDNRILVAEAEALLPTRGRRWGGFFAECEPALFEVQCWPPEKAQAEFLEDFFECWGRRAD